MDVTLRIVDDWVRDEVIAQLDERNLGVCILLGGRPGRASIVYADRGGQRPRVVVKVADPKVAGANIRREASALREAHAALPPEVTSAMPHPLGTLERERFVALAMSAVLGSRARLPSLVQQRPNRRDERLLVSHVRSVRSWSRRLAAASTEATSIQLESSSVGRWAEQFCATDFVPTAARDALSSMLADGALSASWPQVWQHGDVASGNVLYHRGQVRLVDWEASSSTHPPWHDDAYLLLSLARTVDRTRTRDGLLRSLSNRSYAGSALSEVYRADWPHPVPLGLALLLTALQQAGDPDATGYTSSHWTQLAVDLLIDETLRAECEWLVPR